MRRQIGDVIFWVGTGLAIAYAAGAALLDWPATRAALTPFHASCWEADSQACSNYSGRHDLPAVAIFAAAFLLRRLVKGKR